MVVDVVAVAVPTAAVIAVVDDGSDCTEIQLQCRRQWQGHVVRMSRRAKTEIHI